MKPASELAESARRNIFDESFLSSQLRDREMADSFLRNATNQARKTALILGGVMVMTLISVVYAYVQDTLAKQVVREAEILSLEHKRNETEAQKQVAIAQEAAIIAEEAIKMAEETLKECQKNRSQ